MSVRMQQFTHTHKVARGVAALPPHTSAGRHTHRKTMRVWLMRGNRCNWCWYSHNLSVVFCSLSSLLKCSRIIYLMCLVINLKFINSRGNLFKNVYCICTTHLGVQQAFYLAPVVIVCLSSPFMTCVCNQQTRSPLNSFPRRMRSQVVVNTWDVLPQREAVFVIFNAIPMREVSAVLKWPAFHLI